MDLLIEFQDAKNRALIPSVVCVWGRVSVLVAQLRNSAQSLEQGQGGAMALNLK